MVEENIYSVTLAKAASLLGGREALRVALGVRHFHLEAWLSGRSPPPAEVFLRAVDLIESAPPPDPALLARVGAAQQRVLESAVRETGAAFGTLQLLQGGELRLVAQVGFAPPFLDHFAVVRDADCACGAALLDAARICVEDVREHALFAGRAAGEVLANAGVRAVQSTPILGSLRQVLGVLSTHFPSPHAFRAAELPVIDRIARGAGASIESALAAS